MQFEAEIGDVAGSCGYDDDVLDVELRVQFIASRGPADEGRRADFRYFVAIARTDDTVIAREEFDSFIEFPGNQTRAARMLGISRRTLVNRLNEYNLPRPRKRVS